MIYATKECSIDTETYEVRRNGSVVPVEPQVFDLLVLLLENRDRVVTKDEIIEHVWKGRIVSDTALSSRIKAARRALGDDGSAQGLIRTVRRRGFRFVGEVQAESGTAAEPPPAQLHQEVSFCKTVDGVHLAVAATGDGPAVVKAANWLTHVEFDWQSPIWSPLQHRLAAQFRLVRYDQRGTGLSDWDAADISFEAFVCDLETVVDGLGLRRFALFGISQGAAVSMAYAARHPGRVTCLVLCGGYVQGWRKRGSAEEIAQREALLTLMRGWGKNNPAFRQVFTSLLMPGATAEEMEWFNDVQRLSTSPDNAVRLMRVFGDIDVTELLPRVVAPTLVLHSNQDAMIPLEQGLLLGRTIPNARFVALDSPNHLVLSHEPAWQRLANELCGFIQAHSDVSGSDVLR